jgi:NADH dehydrogenase FAD-containing subunit
VVAAPRLLVEPEKFDQTVFSIENVLKKYSKGMQSEFIQGKVVSSNFEDNTIVVGTKDEGEQTIKYDCLIVATGTRTPNAAFKLQGAHEESHSAVNDLSKAIKRAKRVAVLGGGPTGTETAAEIADAYKGEKEVILYTGAKTPIPIVGESRGRITMGKLKDIGVKVVNDIKYTSIKETGDGKYSIQFDNGSTEIFDVYIDASGVVPNSEFLPKSVLNDKGYLVTDRHFRVRCYENVIGFGDILALGNNTIGDLKLAQIAVFDASVKKYIFNQSVKVKDYSPLSGVSIFVPVSRNGGVGVLFGWGVPNFLVRKLKAKDFGIPKAESNFS